MQKVFDLVKYKRIVIGVALALLLWFAILVFGIWDSPKEMYFSSLPENTSVYLNIDTESAGSLMKYLPLVSQYTNQLTEKEIIEIVQKLQNNFVIAIYKDSSSVEQLLVLGNDKAGNTFVYSTDANYNLEATQNRSTSLQKWQKSLNNYLRNEISFYVSEDIHKNTDLDDIIGSIFVEENKKLQFEVEKVSSDVFANTKSIDNILIPEDYLYSVYFDNNTEFKKLFSNLDESVYPVLGTYLDNPSFDFLVNFNKIEQGVDYQITMVNKGHKDLYDNFTNYIKDNLSYLYPIREELTLGDGTLVEEIFADKEAHVKSFSNSHMEVFVEGEDKELSFTIKHDGKNIIITNSIVGDNILLSQLQESCGIKTKKYPFFYKGIDSDKISYYVQNNSNILQGCLSYDE